MEKKKSSIKQLELDLEIWFAIAKIYFPVEIKNSLEQAKAMHEDEIRDSHFDGSGYNNWDAFHNNPDKLNESYNKAKKYYNETFGGEQC